MIRSDGSVSGGRDYREIPIWADVSSEEWNDWRWQFKNRITSVDKLRQVVDLSPDEEEEIKNSLKALRMAITPYFATLMDPKDRDCPIRKRAIPTAKELEISEEDIYDPLAEDTDSPVYGITHRYPDRVLFIVTDQCAMYCRHCTRRRHAGETDRAMPKDVIDRGIEYIRETPQVRDVLLSGGDPCTLPDVPLEKIIRRVYEIPHVEIIRLGTTVPVTMPQRVTPELIKMLKKYQPIYINTHFNHPEELTPESRKACEMLADGGFPLGNQSVLLKGLNDSPIIMKKLVQDLVRIRVRPYYMYQCDLSQGISHFRTSVGKGLEIIENLRGHTSGLCVPTFVVDAPGGGGKIPVMPQYVISRNDRKVNLRNYEGVITTYTEPEDTRSVCLDEDEFRSEFPYLENKEGMARLLEKAGKDGERISLEPKGLERHRRSLRRKEAEEALGKR
ncbi:MAG: lysine 2,3-aminomutase [Candidatus Bipolaricaulota bacterium]|nr:lysine 2,3-aminomutase [Candidatus Bipolaricaulota bacterium]